MRRLENKKMARFGLADRSPRLLPIVLESEFIPASFGLIGRQMLAIDGVKLPSNAGKRRE